MRKCICKHNLKQLLESSEADCLNVRYVSNINNEVDLVLQRHLRNFYQDYVRFIVAVLSVINLCKNIFLGRIAVVSDCLFWNFCNFVDL